MMSSNITNHLPENEAIVSPIAHALISDECCYIFKWIVYALACPFFEVFGIVSNIINIKCFIKLGLKESINVNLLGLAISDLGCVTTLILTSLCLSPWFEELNLPFEPTELQYLISGWPHIIFVRVTSGITALIMVERCVCIAMPLKVKSLFTSKRVAIAMTAIFVFLTCCVSPVYYTSRLHWRFSPERNRTILGLVFTSDRHIVDSIPFAIINICFPVITFVIVSVCTGAIVIHLKLKSKWRAGSTSAGNAEASAVRDQNVAKMVVVLAFLFIICYFPVCVTFMAIIAIPDLSIDGENINVSHIVAGSGLLLESVNSAINICVYYQMSSKYRTIFREMFRLN